MYTTVYELDTSALWKAYVFSPGGGLELGAFVVLSAGCAIFAVWKRRLIFLSPLVPLAMFVFFWAPFMVREFQWGRTLLDLYRSGRCQIAEGAVHVQAQQLLAGHSIDRITVGTTPLEVSHFEVGPQYRDSIVYGGVLKEGAAARVWHCPAAVFQSGASGPIVRVDVTQH